MKTTMIGTKTNEQSAAIVPQPGVTHAIQQQVSLCQFDRLAATLFCRRGKPVLIGRLTGGWIEKRLKSCYLLEIII